MNPPGVVVSTGFADTINVTEMFCMCVSRLITTLPGYVPAASPLGLAVTVNWAGAEPPADEMESHAPVTVAVYGGFAEPVPCTTRSRNRSPTQAASREVLPRLAPQTLTNPDWRHSTHHSQPA